MTFENTIRNPNRRCTIRRVRLAFAMRTCHVALTIERLFGKNDCENTARDCPCVSHSVIAARVLMDGDLLTKQDLE